MSDISQQLSVLRNEIDSIDQGIVELLARRLDVCKEVAEVKSQVDAAVIQPQRVREVLTTRRQWAIDKNVDADFAGLWSPTNSHDPISVKSRTGYVITFASCPVLWSSKLQTEIALSTTEAEYIAMLQAARDLIPMRALLQEFSKATKLIVGDVFAHSTIFEDNRGCVDLATAPRLRPRTKHIGLKYHHFRSHVENGSIKIQWIDSKNQLADIFTKPLAGSLFEYLRFHLLGW